MHFHVVVCFSEVDGIRIDEPEISHARDIGDVLRSDTPGIGVRTYRTLRLSGTNPGRDIILLPLVNACRGLTIFGLRTRGTALENLQHASFAWRVGDKLKKGIKRSTHSVDADFVADILLQVVQPAPGNRFADLVE